VAQAFLRQVAATRCGALNAGEESLCAKSDNVYCRVNFNICYNQIDQWIIAGALKNSSETREPRSFRLEFTSAAVRRLFIATTPWSTVPDPAQF
jgi:hypothetical protein